MNDASSFSSLGMALNIFKPPVGCTCTDFDDWTTNWLDLLEPIQQSISTQLHSHKDDLSLWGVFLFHIPIFNVITMFCFSRAHSQKCSKSLKSQCISKRRRKRCFLQRRTPGSQDSRPATGSSTLFFWVLPLNLYFPLEKLGEKIASQLARKLWFSRAQDGSFYWILVPLVWGEGLPNRTWETRPFQQVFHEIWGLPQFSLMKGYHIHIILHYYILQVLDVLSGPTSANSS